MKSFNESKREVEIPNEFYATHNGVFKTMEKNETKN